MENPNYMSKLPDEMLLKIMEYLESEDLKEASVVCQSWRELVGNCPKLTKHLPLVISFDFPFLEALDISRMIQKVVLSGIDFEQTRDLFAVLEKHGGEVKELVVRRMILLTDHFCDMLRLLPKLQKISLDDIRFNHFNEIKDRVSTTQLTHIVLSECHPNILTCLETSKVVSLKQSNFSFAIFGKQLPALQELYLRRKSSTLEEGTVMITSPELKRLLIGFQDDDLVMNILEEVKNSLEELEMMEPASPQIFDFIFKNFKKLKQLKLNIDRITSGDLVNLCSMPHVTTLILQSHRRLHEGVYPFIGSLPNIETLVIDCDIDDDDSNPFMTFVSQNLQKLRVLEMRNVGNLTFRGLNMSSLRELLIHEMIIKDDGLKSITQCCANIEKLAVESPYDLSAHLNPRIVTVADDLKKLQQIYLGTGFIATELILSHVYNKLPELKTFTIMDSAVKDDPALVEKFPRLIIATKRVNFSRAVDIYAREDVKFVCYEDDNLDFESDYNDLDFDPEDVDDDDFVRYDDLEDWQPGDDEDNSDEDYVGFGARPG